MEAVRGFGKTVSFAILIACTALSAGCGGGGQSGTTTTAGVANDTVAAPPSTSAPTSTGTDTLTISGTPATSVAAGATYRFTPTVSGGTSIAFSVANKPAWASFDTTTGTLSGTPSGTDQGDYGNIVISVASATQSASLAAFRINVGGATSGSATLSWQPPTQNTDGSAIANLAGYNIYYGSDATAMNNRIQVTNPGLTSYTITGLDSGTHYFGITAITSNGVESDLSSVGSASIM